MSGTIKQRLISFLRKCRQRQPVEHNQGYSVQYLAQKIHAKSNSVSGVLTGNTEFEGTTQGHYKLSSTV